jgi:hypothetical protein
MCDTTAVCSAYTSVPPSHTPLSSPPAHGHHLRHYHTLPLDACASRAPSAPPFGTRAAPAAAVRYRRRRTDRHQAHHSRLPPDSALSSWRLRLSASPAGPTPVPGARQVSRSPSRACNSLSLCSLRRPQHPSTLSLCPPLSKNTTRSHSIISSACEHQLSFAFVASPHAATFLVVF